MAGSLTDSAEGKILDLIFLNTAWAYIGNAGGLLPSSADGTLTLELYKTAPSDSSAGTLCDYANYAAVTLNRGAAYWERTTSSMKNKVAIAFPAMGAGAAQTALAWGIKDTNGTLIIWGDITTPVGGLICNAGVAPTFQINQLIINAD